MIAEAPFGGFFHSLARYFPLGALAAGFHRERGLAICDGQRRAVFNLDHVRIAGGEVETVGQLPGEMAVTELLDEQLLPGGWAGEFDLGRENNQGVACLQRTNHSGTEAQKCDGDNWRENAPDS